MGRIINVVINAVIRVFTKKAVNQGIKSARASHRKKGSHPQDETASGTDAADSDRTDQGSA